LYLAHLDCPRAILRGRARRASGELDKAPFQPIDPARVGTNQNEHGRRVRAIREASSFHRLPRTARAWGHGRRPSAQIRIFVPHHKIDLVQHKTVGGRVLASNEAADERVMYSVSDRIRKRRRRYLELPLPARRRLAQVLEVLAQADHCLRFNATRHHGLESMLKNRCSEDSTIHLDGRLLGEHPRARARDPPPPQPHRPSGYVRIRLGGKCQPRRGLRFLQAVEIPWGSVTFAMERNPIARTAYAQRAEAIPDNAGCIGRFWNVSYAVAFLGLFLRQVGGRQ
jgi:hypothetical protein